MSNLKGKIALVTGAATRKSMGRAIALQLATEGADVVVADKFAVPPILRSEDKDWRGLHSVIEEMEALGAKGLAVKRMSATARMSTRSWQRPWRSSGR